MHSRLLIIVIVSNVTYLGISRVTVSHDVSRVMSHDTAIKMQSSAAISHHHHCCHNKHLKHLVK